MLKNEIIVNVKDNLWSHYNILLVITNNYKVFYVYKKNKNKYIFTSLIIKYYPFYEINTPKYKFFYKQHKIGKPNV